MSGSMTQPTGLPGAAAFAACAAFMSDWKYVDTQLVFCMLVKSTLVPSTFPFIP